MNQSQKDAILMKQIFEKVLSVLYDNGVMYTKQNIYRVAQLFMALSVNMVGMSSNDLQQFRHRAQKLVDDMNSMLDGMDPKRRAQLFDAVERQISWFEKEYDKQKKEFDEQQEDTEKKSSTSSNGLN